jgi:hypothetical protein
LMGLGDGAEESDDWRSLPTPRSPLFGLSATDDLAEMLASPPSLSRQGEGPGEGSLAGSHPDGSGSGSGGGGGGGGGGGESDEDDVALPVGPHAFWGPPRGSAARAKARARDTPRGADGKFRCPEPGCVRTFGTKPHLTAHMLFHEGFSYECPGCHKSQENRSGSAKHIARCQQCASVTKKDARKEVKRQKDSWVRGNP